MTDQPTSTARTSVPIHQKATRLNEPMVARLHKCAADTDPNWAGQITIYPPEARNLTALIAETAALRGVAEQAAYFSGVQECLDGECEHLEDPETDEPCPILEERHATADDVIRAQIYEEALDGILYLLDTEASDKVGDYIRTTIRQGKDKVAELAAPATRPNVVEGGEAR